MFRFRDRCALAVLVLGLCLALAACGADAATADDKTVDDIKPLSSIDAGGVIGLVIIGIGMALASAGGVGGGVICVPVLILLMDFDIKFATAASNVVVLGGAIANAIVNMQKRHPLHELVDRPLIDPDLMFGMIPPVVGGAVLGAILSKLLPSYVISLSFVVVLAFGAQKTLRKGWQLHKKEVAAKKADAEAASAEVVSSPKAAPFTEVETPLVEVQGEGEANTDENSADLETSSVETSEEKQEALAEILKKESRFSWFKHGITAFCYLGVLLMTVAQVASKCGSSAYWILLIGEIPWVVIFSFFFVHYMTKKHARKVAVHYKFIQGDVQWNSKNVVWFPIICGIAGVVAGLFGVGGGIIVGPLMIEIGVIPQVSAATAALMILYGSAAAVTKFAVFEMIKWDWALTISAMTFVVTLLSQYFIGNYIRRTRRESIVVFCIGITVSIGGVFMAYQAIRSTVDTAGKPFRVDFCR